MGKAHNQRLGSEVRQGQRYVTCATQGLVWGAGIIRRFWRDFGEPDSIDWWLPQGKMKLTWLKAGLILTVSIGTKNGPNGPELGMGGDAAVSDGFIDGPQTLEKVDLAMAEIYGTLTRRKDEK